jgi:NAD-reducing hydrogenase large subunit
VGRRIVIDPVTRIEGHAHVTIELGEDGRVADARVHVAQVRGFEAFCTGRLLHEMPALTARVCGICPVSHGIASAKACDAILGAEPPPAARRLRGLLQLAQLVQSHALSFFLLSAPDLVPRRDADPARRSFLGLAEEEPDLVRDGIALRRFGQHAIERIAGRRVHPAFAVPGGVAWPLEAAARDELRAALPDALDRARRTLDGWWRRLPDHAEEASALDLETPFLAMVGARGDLDLCEGRLRVVSAAGEPIADGVDPARYEEVIGERDEPWSYARLACWRALGPVAGAFRVGPLARLNVVRRCGTPLADAELERFRSLAPGPVRSTFHAHLARLVEIVFALERIGELLDDPETLGREVLASPGAGRSEGVGACEAPRGTLLHHYRVDPAGVVTFVNLIVATGLNGLAMNRTVRLIAERWLDGGRITQALLDRVEAGIRAFDPCLSCATHADGARRATLRLMGAGGEVIDEAPA